MNLHVVLWVVTGAGVVAAAGDLVWQWWRGRRDADAGAGLDAAVRSGALSPDERRALDSTAIDRRFAAPRPAAPVVVDLRGEPLPALPRGEQATDEIPQPRAGRHRRDEAGPAAVTMTGFMRQLDARTVELHRRSLEAIAAETGELPRVQA